MRKEIQPIKICFGTFLSIHALSIDERRSARYWVKTNFRGRSQKKVAPVHGSVTKIDKSISQRSFPAYRVFVREAATLQYARDARIGDFHRSGEIAPGRDRERQNQRSEGKRRNEFPPRSEKRLMT